MRGPGSGDRWAFTARGVWPKWVWRSLLKKDIQSRNSSIPVWLLPVCFASVCSAVFKVEKCSEKQSTVANFTTVLLFLLNTPCEKKQLQARWASLFGQFNSQSKRLSTASLRNPDKGNSVNIYNINRKTFNFPDFWKITCRAGWQDRE